jgi:hypothetical protein
VLAGVKDLRNEVEAAQRRLEQHGLRSRMPCCPGWRTERSP